MGMRQLLLILLLISSKAFGQTPLHRLISKHTTVAPDPITFVAQVGAASTDGNDITTGSINTTGATLLVAAIANSNFAGGGSVTDSKGNTWTPLTEQINVASTCRIRLFYSFPTSVGAGHTFSTNAGITLYPAIQVFAFSGGAGSFGSENGTTGGASPVSTGTVTPSTDGQVIIAAFGDAASSIDAITAGFTKYDVAYGAGVNFSVSMAYYIQPTAGAQGCTFTFTGTTGGAAIACFR